MNNRLVQLRSNIGLLVLVNQYVGWRLSIYDENYWDIQL
jgi:hypothetical protein